MGRDDHPKKKPPVPAETIEKRNRHLAELVAEDKRRGARGEYAIPGWRAQLRNENRIPADPPWAGQLPDILVTYLTQIHGEPIGKWVLVCPNGSVRVLKSGRTKRPFVTGRTLYPLASADEPAFVQPVLVGADDEGNVT